VIIGITTLLTIFAIFLLGLSAVRRIKIMKVNDYRAVAGLVVILGHKSNNDLVLFSCAWNRRGVNVDLWADLWYAYLSKVDPVKLRSMFEHILDEVRTDLWRIPVEYGDYAEAAHVVLTTHADTDYAHRLSLLDECYMRTFRGG